MKGSICMTPVFQTRFVHLNGTGDCFNACVASIFDLSLEEASDITPESPGVWFLNWKKWFRARGWNLDITSRCNPPFGYTIVSCETGRVFPEDHPQAGRLISHACIAHHGRIIHDPYPGGLATSEYTVKFYYKITPFSDLDDND